MSETTTDTPVEDLEPIAPTEQRVTVNGYPCMVRRLKTREFLSLMNVLTSGMGSALAQVRLDFSDADAVAGDLAALMLLAIPNAADEFALFLRTIVYPIDDKDRAAVAAYLIENPDLDVMLEVFEAVATQEKDDLVVLAGKAQAMWSRLSRLYTQK